MPDRRFAILDPAAGISGDMVLGALIAAGADPTWLRALPGRLGVPDVRIDIGSVDRGGVRATKVDVVLPDGSRELPSPPVSQEHGHGHGHMHGPGEPGHAPHHGHGSHRHVGELLEILERAPLSPWVRERAIRAFTLLGDA